MLLSHMGLAKDREIAQKTEGIDVIIGGHTHELVEGIKEGDNLLYSKTGEPVIITEAGRDGNYFGQLNLVFDKRLVKKTDIHASAFIHCLYFDYFHSARDTLQDGYCCRNSTDACGFSVRMRILFVML